MQEHLRDVFSSVALTSSREIRDVFGNANSLGNVSSPQQSVLTPRAVTAHRDGQKTAITGRLALTLPTVISGC